jgi:type II secretory pathway component PulF
MSTTYDRGLFPQCLLRFLATCERLATPPLEAIRLFRDSFRLGGGKQGQLALAEKALASGATVPLLRWSGKNGRSPQALEGAARQMDLEARLELVLVRELSYPAVLITIALVISSLWHGLIGPQFTSIMTSIAPAGTPLHDATPWPWLDGVARALSSLGQLWELVPFLLVMWVWLLATACFPWMAGHRRLREALCFVVAPVRRVRAMARQALQVRLLASGLAVGVPAPEALDEVSALSMDRATQAALRAAAAAIRRGGRPDEAFAGHAGWPFWNSVALAFRSPAAVPALERLADGLQEEAEAGLMGIARHLAPVITLVVVALVSLVPVSQYLNLMQMYALTRDVLK